MVPPHLRFQPTLFSGSTSEAYLNLPVRPHNLAYSDALRATWFHRTCPALHIRLDPRSLLG